MVTMNSDFIQQCMSTISSMMSSTTSTQSSTSSFTQPSVFPAPVQQPVLPINPQTGQFDIGILAGNSAFGGQQPIFGFPNAGAALMPTHTLYNFGSGMYNLISKYRSPVYRQPLSITLGMLNNPYQTPFSNTPLDFLGGQQYYTGGGPTNGSATGAPFGQNLPDLTQVADMVNQLFG